MVLEVNVQPKLWSCARPKLEIVAFSPSGRSMRWRHTNLPLDAIANMLYRFLDRFPVASSLLYATVSVAMSGSQRVSSALSVNPKREENVYYVLKTALTGPS